MKERLLNRDSKIKTLMNKETKKLLIRDVKGWQRRNPNQEFQEARDGLQAKEKS